MSGCGTTLEYIPAMTYTAKSNAHKHDDLWNEYAIDAEQGWKSLAETSATTLRRLRAESRTTRLPGVYPIYSFVKDAIQRQVMGVVMNRRDAVIAALENSRYLWRTADGIAHDTGMTIDEVADQLLQLQDELVRPSRLSVDGKQLYTTREHYRHTASFWRKFASAIANRIV